MLQGDDLPRLRKFARALTGSQSRGDACIQAALEALLASDMGKRDSVSLRLALYRAFHMAWPRVARDNTRIGTENDIAAPTMMDWRLQALAPGHREAMLLTRLEGFSSQDAATILGCTADDVRDLVAGALRAMRREGAPRSPRISRSARSTSSHRRKEGIYSPCRPRHPLSLPMAQTVRAACDWFC